MFEQLLEAACEVEAKAKLEAATGLTVDEVEASDQRRLGRLPRAFSISSRSCTGSSVKCTSS